MSLILGNLELQQPNYFAYDFGWRFWIDQGRDEMPTFRGGSDFLPMRPGRLHLRRIGDSVPLMLKGYVKARTKTEFRQALDILHGLFDPTISVPIRLTDTMPDGSQRYLNVVPNNSIANSDNVEPVRIYSVQLDSMDAQWRTNWGTLTADSAAPIYADTGAMASPIGSRPYFADSSAEALIYPSSWKHTFQLDTRSIGMVEEIRVTFDQGSVGSDNVNDPTGDIYPGSSSLGVICTPAGSAIPTTAYLDTSGSVGIEINLSPPFTGPGPAFVQQKHLQLGRDLLVIDNRLRRFEWAGAATGWAWQSMLSAIDRFPANRGGELIRFGPGVQTVTIFGWPYRARIQWTPTIP